jgi:Domain of unknown function (DUF309)
VLEDAWRAAAPAERDFFQGLVHVAVAWYQAGRGNRVGCERQLEKAARRLAPYAPAHRSVDVAATLLQVRAAQETLRTQPDGLEHMVVGGVDPPPAVEEQDQAEGDEQDAADRADDPVVVPEPAEGAHRRDEGDARE